MTVTIHLIHVMFTHVLDVSMVVVSEHLVFEVVEGVSMVKEDVQQQAEDVTKIFYDSCAKLNTLLVSI